ncbi:hypothetical protein HPS57_10435 [Prevotella sp. PINT]|jgi:hypothetical protein|uniref:hypothetical protein n=1 Tax=Palleniella intestinalis TaxID=2736291 RepID=UPI001556F263|nr:hypothetical protein [Palleniella intestinalis]NPD82385.1 hypothetical protein [Palleniella intestinalis]
MNETDIIIRELTKEELSARKPFSHFGWEGAGAFSFFTISEGYWKSAKMLLERMEKESNNFAIVDSLVYPLFFNYRHSIETYLKLLFFKYGGQTEQDRRNFLDLGHDLQNLWVNLRPHLNKGKKHVGSTINLNAMEHYIKSINRFDPDSMMMRYSIEKDLKANKEHDHHFDFVNFGKRMNELCVSFRQLDDDLSNQMLEMASLEELNTYLGMIEKYRPKIDSFLSILKAESKEEAIKTFNIYDFFDNLKSYEPSNMYKFLNECDPDVLILLDNLFYGGRTVNSNEIRLSTSPVCRQKEFVKFCFELLDNDGLCFRTVPREEQINIFGKTASALLDGISTALSIIDLESNN